jgi:beta-lactamase regulating signal transducer with metallopeptidase domain
MNKVMFLFLSLSVSGSLLALIMFALKPVIKKRLGQTWQYYIWLVVVLRFLLPFTPQISVVGELARYVQNITAPLAIVEVNPGADINEEIIAPQSPEIAPPSEITQSPPVPAQATQPAEAGATAQALVWRDIFDNLWLLWLGVALVLFVHKAVSYRSFVRFIRIGSGNEKITDEHMLELYREELAAAKIKEKLPLYRNNQATSPMLVGIIHPALIIPPIDAGDKELRSILRHELTHYKRLDFLYKWLVQITLCLHWFNPVVYLIHKQINKNCELSCDESVIKSMDKGERISYGNALLA